MGNSQAVVQSELTKHLLIKFIVLYECSSWCPQKSYNGNNQKIADRASLVAQWLGICLLMQGTRVRALVWEDPTCRGAARPVSHNY